MLQAVLDEIRRFRVRSSGLHYKIIIFLDVLLWLLPPKSTGVYAVSLFFMTLAETGCHTCLN